MLSIKYHPHKTMTVDEFCSQTEEGSVAIDGLVIAPTHFRPDSRKGVIDHHTESIDGKVVPSTCLQTYDLCMNGTIAEAFGKHIGRGGQKQVVDLAVHANSPDEDVLTTFAVLRAFIEGKNYSKDLLRQIAVIEDGIDRHLGVNFVTPTTDEERVFEERLLYVFDPCAATRCCYRRSQLTERDMLAIHTNVCDRFNRLLSSGKGKRKSFNGSYRVVHQDADFVCIEELGGQARTQAYRDGHRKIISVRNGTDDRHGYTIMDFSQGSKPYLAALQARLNNEDASVVAGTNRWGGGNLSLFTASPRATGSTLDVNQLCALIAQVRAETPQSAESVIKPQALVNA